MLYHVTIPATANAKPLGAPSTSKRWPVLIFSHGLGGSRNAYSHLLGLLSSYGVVAIAPEHRDGSAPISFVKDSSNSKLVPIDYHIIPHDFTREVQEARDKQLRIRLWELGLVHEALLKIDRGETLLNIASEVTNKEIRARSDLLNFTASLDVQQPGRISWAGHSFGAATVVQFIKSVFYRQQSSGYYRPLYVPCDDSPIVRQVTPFSTISLLDLWTLPLRSESTKWLWAKPLPCYTDNGPGGSVILAILSEGFFRWRGNLVLTKKAISATPSDERPHISTRSSPHIFYPEKTAHLSQSDFGVLFPWLTKRVFKAEEPERTLKLNVLAVLELIRRSGLDVPALSDVDKASVLTPAQDLGNIQPISKVRKPVNGHENGASKPVSLEPLEEVEILSVNSSIRGWIAVSVDAEDLPGEGEDKKTKFDAPPSDAVQQTEIIDNRKHQD